MKNNIKKKHFVGVDISNTTLDLALLKEETYGTFKDKRIENSLPSFDIILKWLEKENVQFKDCLFCMEHTGNYGLLFFAWLSQKGIDYCVECEDFPCKFINKKLLSCHPDNPKYTYRHEVSSVFVKSTNMSSSVIVSFIPSNSE